MMNATAIISMHRNGIVSNFQTDFQGSYESVTTGFIETCKAYEAKWALYLMKKMVSF